MHTFALGNSVGFVYSPLLRNQVMCNLDLLTVGLVYSPLSL
jgi:hypothetical protein